MNTFLLIVITGVVLFIVLQVFRLPFDLQSYDVSAMPSFDASSLQAGDLVFLRWNDWYYTKLVTFWTHVQLIVNIDGKLYAAEIRTDAQLDALDGTMRQMVIRDPKTAITTYGGTYCVRRRVTPLSQQQSAALTRAVMQYRNDTYTTDFVWTYVASFTPFAWKYRNKGQAWCSLIVADWLRKARIADMFHPCWVLPNDLASKWTPFGFTSHCQANWSAEEIPVWP